MSQYPYSILMNTNDINNLELEKNEFGQRCRVRRQMN